MTWSLDALFRHEERDRRNANLRSVEGKSSMTGPKPAESAGRGTLRTMPELLVAEYRRAAGFRSLNPLWAKAEIVLGLSAAVCGLRLLFGDVQHAAPGGALAVLGAYLAMAGHRSHLYMAMNRQAAYLLFALGGFDRPGQDTLRAAGYPEDQRDGKDPPTDCGG